MYICKHQEFLAFMPHTSRECYMLHYNLNDYYFHGFVSIAWTHNFSVLRVRKFALYSSCTYSLKRWQFSPFIFIYSNASFHIFFYYTEMCLLFFFKNAQAVLCFCIVFQLLIQKLSFLLWEQKLYAL